ncbi:hypothetical protein [Undibacterium griseum]|uniref:Uncharacterized protein n=1 Tax=Undibacterium griseum TaxID=2762295 RepID=A0ABR6YMI8_9BURK|nr:hypothetical protein [Undibacterium griseum]MBC3885101.1 hypothetical protein [Undibacterium griseum]
MQTAFTLMLLLIAAGYLLLKWMPSSVQQGIMHKVGQKYPVIAAHLASATKACGSSCSSSCHGCDTQKTSEQTTDQKPVIFIRKMK